MSAGSAPSISRLGAVHGHVLDTLGLRIVSGELPPGAQLLTEDHLASDLQVSKGALREAVKGLVAKGLLAVSPRTGTRVTSREAWNFLDVDVLRWLSEHDKPALMKALTELRAALEPGAARLAALRATDDDLARLAQAYQGMCDAANRAEFVEADVAFHAAMLRACHNELYISLGGAIDYILRNSLEITAGVDVDLRRSLPQHGLVVAALEAGEATTAAAAVGSLLATAEHALETAGFLDRNEQA
jgi:DNA-binding FadR family transcriptional regulator